MSEDIPAKIARLPQWAQTHIAKLSRERDRAQTLLRTYTGVEKTQVEHVQYAIDAPSGGPLNRLYIPSYDTIRYTLREHATIDVRIGRGVTSVRYLDVCASGGDGELQVYPRATNSLLIGIRHRESEK